MATGICAQTGGFVNIKVGENRCNGERILTIVKAFWWSGDQRKSFLVLRSGRNGVSRGAMVFVLDES